MKNKIIKDALALTLITLVAGVALGGVYEITKDPIARQEAQAKAEAYEQVFTDAAAFEEVKMDDTLIQTIRDQLDQEGYKAQSIEEIMRAEDQSGEMLGYAFTVVTSEPRSFREFPAFWVSTTGFRRRSACVLSWTEGF